MTNLIIGNIFCLFSMITDSISAKKNTTKEILLYQSMSQVIYCTSSIILGGYSAAVQNVVTIIRNFIASQDKSNNLIEHKIFRNVIDYFKSGDVLVLNNSKVIPLDYFIKQAKFHCLLFP